MVTIRISAPSNMLAANLLGALGLIAIVLAAGGLTGNWWWSALVGGVFAVTLSVFAMTHEAAKASRVGEAVDDGEAAARPALSTAA